MSAVFFFLYVQLSFKFRSTHFPMFPLFLQTFPDNACKREILSLQVLCNNHSLGCEWSGVLKNLEVSL